MGERLDIIVFGITGFTGQHAVGTLIRILTLKNSSLKWGVAGRNESKVRSILNVLETESGKNFSEVPVIIANLDDEKSIQEMASRARLVINCCGPYRFMGEKVVKACIDAKTHHIDVSGEPQYMEKMQLDYHDKARQAGVYVVSACGFDSIPCDMGVLFLGKKFSGTLNSAETYLRFGNRLPFSGPAINYATWESAVYGLAHADELRPIRTKLYPKRLPRMEPALPFHKFPFKPEGMSEWAVPFPGSDRSVVLRSQRYLYEEKKKRPVQVQTYCMFRSIWHIIMVSFFGAIFSVFAKFQMGRSLLLKYPSIFSGGMFSTEPPSKDAIENSWFSITVIGKGWKEILSDPLDKYTSPPNKSMTVEVKGANPAYGSTCICLVLSGLVILNETDKLPSGGGVYPPGAVFAETSLIDQLNDNGVTFEIVSESDF